MSTQTPLLNRSSVLGGRGLGNPATSNAPVSATGVMRGGEVSRAVVVGHFDVHGVLTAYLASKYFNAVEAFAKFPETGPENLVSLLQNRYMGSASRLSIVIVDIPVNVKAPQSFINGLEEIATRHEVIFYDHHETSIPYISQFSLVKPVFIGTSAYDLTRQFVRDPDDGDIAVIAAIGDRDPEVIRRGLWNRKLQIYADGLDVLIRRDANRILKELIADVDNVLAQAESESENIPTASVERQIGLVGYAGDLRNVGEGWSLKALERMAFTNNFWYAVGYTYVSRFNTWTVRAIVRWDVLATRNIVTPGAVAKELWPTRTIIGHPSAPSINASSEDEAKEIAIQLAEALAERSVKRSGTVSLINTEIVGDALAEILTSLRQILEEQKKMYSEYLELKRRQVELLEQTESRVRAD